MRTSLGYARSETVRRRTLYRSSLVRALAYDRPISVLTPPLELTSTVARFVVVLQGSDWAVILARYISSRES